MTWWSKTVHAMFYKDPSNVVEEARREKEKLEKVKERLDQLKDRPDPLAELLRKEQPDDC